MKAANKSILLRLDHRNPVPLRIQVEQLIRSLTQLPEYVAGKPLPDENSLARMLGISRMTLRTGMAPLIFEGLLERRRGVGTRVARRSQQSGLGSWYSLTREMEAKGLKVVNYRILARKVALPSDIAGALNLKPGTPVLRLERLRGWNGLVVTHMVTWFHPRLKLDEKTDFNRPLFETVEQSAGFVMARTREEVAARPADPTLAKLLNVAPGVPLLYRSQTILDAAEKPLFHNRNYYRGDLFTLTLDIRRE